MIVLPITAGAVLAFIAQDIIRGVRRVRQPARRMSAEAVAAVLICPECPGSMSLHTEWCRMSNGRGEPMRPERDERRVP